MPRADWLDLTARGFFRSHLPRFTGFCLPCNDYRTFGWWQSPRRGESFDLVACCESCKVVARGDETHVTRHPVTMERAS